jgi:hypothetical protein
VRCGCGTVITKFRGKGLAGGGVVFAFIGFWIALYGLIVQGWGALTDLF